MSQSRQMQQSTPVSAADGNALHPGPWAWAVCVEPGHTPLLQAAPV